MHKISHSNSRFASQNASQEQITRKIAKSNYIKYTDLSIRNLKATSARIIYWFEGLVGFGIRVSPKGRKTWIYMYRFENRSRMMTLGTYPRMSLAEARIEYANASQKVELGFDPGKKQVEENIFQREADTVEDLLVKYIDYSKAKGKKSWRTEEVELRRDILPIIGRKKVHEVKKRDLMPIFHKMIVERNAPIGAKHLFAYVRRMFNIAVMWDMIEYNPCSNLKLNIKSNKKDRHLSPSEIHKFWSVMDDADAALVIRLALKFMLCTASRGVEVRTMEWSHLDENSWVWTIPETKNAKMHRVYLHGKAKEIINQVRSYTGGSKYVFGSMRHEKQPINKPTVLNPLGQTSLSRAINNNRKSLDMEKDFTPHDLRRTAATLVTAMGCPRQWAKLVLNHTTSDITGIYDQYAYDWEKNKALEILDYAITRIVDCKSILEIPSLLQLREEIRNKNIYRREY